MRKTDNMEFKGSIFTELETQEQADKIVENKEMKIGEEETMLIMKRYINFLYQSKYSYQTFYLPH